MVAIVSGNSLGLELTTLGTLGSRGLFGLPGQGASGEQVYVNALTGNLVVQRRDGFLASQGLDNEAVRTYNSLGLLTDDNGDNWSLGIYAQQIALQGTVNTAGSLLIRTARDGSQATYQWDATRNCYLTKDGGGAHDTIVYDSAATQYVRTDSSTGGVEKYSAADGRLQSVTDADGNTSTYAYSGGKLSKVVDPSGETIWYDYTAGLLTGIRTQAGGVIRSAVTYGYDTSSRLSSVTVDLTPADTLDSSTYVTNYTYDGSTKRLKTLTQADGTQLTFTYVAVGADMRVETITDALGAVTRYDYANGRTTVTDPLQKTWVYEYDGTGQLMAVSSPAVGGAVITQRYTYDADGNVKTITNGDGETVTMDYDANGNQIQVTDHLQNRITRTYSSSSNQLLTETVGSSTTRYVYSATKTRQLRYVVSPEGRVTQFIYDDVGQRKSEISYTQAAYSTAGLGGTDVPTEAQMNTWASGLADLTKTTRKDYAYDPRGLLNTVSEYLTVSADGTGNGLRLTQYIYDPSGRLLQVLQPAANTGEEAGTPTTTYTYNGLGLVETQTQAYGTPEATVTRYTYEYWDGAKQKTIKRQAGTDLDWAPGMSDMTYDANGFLISARDNTGHRKMTYFNSATGQVLRRDELRENAANTTADDVTFSHYWYYANSRRVGEVTTDPDDNQRVSYAEALARSLADPKKEAERNKNVKPVTSADFDQNYEPIGPSYPASTPSTYTCSTGDTLRSVALALWGDSEMWFLLAQVNNLQADVSLAAGQVLIVPNRVTNIHNNAFTFRPYNPGEVIGHIDPTLPAPPPPPHQGGCGGVGTIIMVVVAVVVTIYTAGAASTLLAGGSLGGFGATMTAGVGVLGGGAAVGAAGGLLSAGMAGLAGAAIGGAVGSIASQAVGMAIGATDDFSWKAVAHGALAAGATAGVGSMLQGAGVINETGNLITESGEVTNWTRMGGAALSQGLSSAATQAIEGKWSWRQIASAAVGGAAGAAAGSAMNSAFGTSAGSDFARFSKGLASSVAGGWASSRVMATDSRYRTAELSSLFAAGFGQAIGQSLVDAMQPEPIAGPGLKFKPGEADNWGPHYSFDDVSMATDYRLDGGTGVRLGGYAGGASRDDAWTREVYRNGELIEAGRWNGAASSGSPVEVDPVTGAETYAVREPQIQTRSLPPIARRSVAYGDESFGQYYMGQLGESFQGIQNRLDSFAADAGTSDGMRFLAAMAKNPAKWFGDAVTGTGAVVTYALDSQFRSQVNGGIGNFFSNDPIGTTQSVATRYWDEHSGLELARDSFNLVAGGMVGAPVAKLPGMALSETVSLTGAAGEQLLGWSQKLTDYSLEWPALNGRFGQAGAVVMPSIRNLRAEVSELLPEGFDLVRMGRGGAAIVRFGDNTFYSVPKSQYSLIPELRSMDAMGDVFTQRVQAIADDFDPANNLTFGQRLRLDATPDGWLKNKFMSAYKGSYVHDQFKDVLGFIDGGDAYSYKTVGPDVVQVGGSGNGLKYEITQFTPSLNAIYSHTSKYSNELLRYVTYR